MTNITSPRSVEEDAGGGLGPAGREALERATGKHAGQPEPLSKGLRALFGLDKKKEPSNA